MVKQRFYKIALLLLALIVALTAIYFHRNRFTPTEEEYTYTYYYFENDELKSKATYVMNKYDDRLSYTDETYITYTPRIYNYYYKYDKSGNKKLCINIMKNETCKMLFVMTTPPFRNEPEWRCFKQLCFIHKRL